MPRKFPRKRDHENPARRSSSQAVPSRPFLGMQMDLEDSEGLDLSAHSLLSYSSDVVSQSLLHLLPSSPGCQSLGLLWLSPTPVSLQPCLSGVTLSNLLGISSTVSLLWGPYFLLLFLIQIKCPGWGETNGQCSFVFDESGLRQTVSYVCWLCQNTGLSLPSASTL